ncbi:HAD hydrolase-like protein [Rhodanobacter lindaniclasticus]|uniref:HAD family hydrolase n=1 Tax=Rhodanobacter lindaniclasticus TaxID=75310 RepID=A0A4S3KJ86_9GAMM|nr:HAD hydrolase-like protein [Rhodanobacter lindaniclasticus]THD08670.1 HAD family hydrolase [Rhodanobacter lindaniclasticus]
MLCLFDLDGTLIDSEHGITACVKHALARLDVTAPPHEELRRWIGPPLRHSFAPLLDHDAGRIEAAVEYYHERFNTLGWREHEIYPGIEALVEQLLAAGHRLAVVTSKPHRHAAPIIAHLPFGEAFLRLYGPHPDSPHSEKATMIAEALADFDSDPADAVMIGDRHFDIDGAVGNGIRSIGVLWGFGMRHELLAAGATALVDSPEALLASIEGFSRN